MKDTNLILQIMLRRSKRLSAGLEGKVVLVTGGASGIGAAIVKRFAEQKASVVIADITERGFELSEHLKSNGYSAEFIRTDIRSADETKAMVSYAEKAFDGLDILVNCAGIFPRAELLETTEELWNKIMDINLKGTYHSCQAAVPALVRRGEGVIVNIGSLNAYGGAPNLFAYSTSKGGVMTMTLNLARSLAKHKIRVNCVNPGWVVTEGEKEVQSTEGQPDGWIEAGGRKMPLGRLQTPEDIAPAVLFLTSVQASQITGQIISVDGGLGLYY
jgi:NAD(P)-dependent dehydrogenase (short-subunit alcohol dehydrogenase family)